MKKAKRAKKMNSPIDDALESTTKLAAQYRAEEQTLWEAWKQEPTEGNMHTLLRRFEPVFKQKDQQHRAPNVNPAAFKTNLKVHAVKAFQTYDPTKGTALRTHVENNLKRSMRFNAQQQNMAYIPEGQTQYIGAVDRAKDELMEELGRDPSHVEVSQFLKQRPELLGGKKPPSPTLVGRVEGNRRRDILGSAMEIDPSAFFADRNRQIQGLLPAELTPDEQRVYNHLYGMNGARKITSTTALATQLGKSTSQISRLKSSIATKYKQFL